MRKAVVGRPQDDLENGGHRTLLNYETSDKDSRVNQLSCDIADGVQSGYALIRAHDHQNSAAIGGRHTKLGHYVIRCLALLRVRSPSTSYEHTTRDGEAASIPMDLPSGPSRCCQTTGGPKQCGENFAHDEQP